VHVRTPHQIREVITMRKQRRPRRPARPSCALPSARLVSGVAGQAGRATIDTPAYDPTAGRRASDTAGVRRPKRNTNLSASMGGAGINAYRPEELARESLTYVSAPHVMRSAAGRRLGTDGMSRAQLGDVAVAEGIRQRALTERSIMITNGARGVETVPMRVQEDGTWDTINDRTIMLTVPVWTKPRRTRRAAR
jgi:hypothetical protein